MLTMREITDGFGKMAREWNGAMQLEMWRTSWADHANRSLERAGRTARINNDGGSAPILVNIAKFLALESEFQMSSEDAQELNKNLSEVSARDIPEEKIDHVLDYLIAALNAEFIDLNIEIKIDKLVSDPQRTR